MTHVFISPHPDDAALSCGGLIASLRELGQNVTIISVYSGGARDGEDLTDYQRFALGFGSKAVWPNTEAFRRSHIPPDVELAPGDAPWAADPGRIAVTQERAATQARQFWQRAAWTRSANVTNLETPDRPLADSIGNQGSDEELDVGAADAMAVRRLEDERYAYFIEASLISLELPDAVFRGYVGDEELLGAVHPDDPAPYDALRREILRLEPQMVYVPLAVGNHVDHQQCREVGQALLEEGRRWVMPGPDFGGRLSFYEDFPYAWWQGFSRPTDLPGGPLDLPPGLDLTAEYADIGDQMERKVAGLRVYASQVPHLFDSDQAMLDGVAQYHARVATEGGVPGYAERYWTAARP
ncbi:MAG: PIG-L deacetylase family protein [Candidatus Limnocylindrales bacterium]